MLSLPSLVVRFLQHSSIAFLGSYYADSIELDRVFYEGVLKKSTEEDLGYSLLKDALVG